MNELLSELIQILEAQRDAQAALVGLSEKKTKAISMGDAAGLQAIVDEERAMLAHIKAIDRKQGQCAAKLAALYDVPAQDVRMTLVIERAEGETKLRLETLRDELGALIGKQAAHNDVNMKLLQMNMDYVQFLINASSHQQLDPTYSNGGSMQKTVGTSKRLLDRKV
jgi:flagellar biosynthesis/type III secretory pathway chaperone